MNPKRTNLRKIILGENLSDSIKYQKGSTYKLPIGDCTLTDLVENEKDSTIIDLYLSNDGLKFLWKSVNVRGILEFEYDSNFE